MRAAKDAIVESIKLGAYFKHAAGAANINFETARTWRKTDLEFADRILQAQGHAVMEAVRVIQRAAFTDWKAAAWWLERAHPKEWSDRLDLRVTHEGGLTLEAAMFADPALTVEAEEVIAEIEAPE
jgi:DNA-binding GntR family transcriptional regulator